MVMQAMRYGASNQIIKTVLFGLLMLAAIGLAFSGGGGLLGNGGSRGVSRNDVARIGNETIALQSFDRSLRRALSRLGIQPAEAYKLGYVNQFLGGEVRGRIIAKAASDTGIMVDRKRIVDQIRTIVAPMVKNGQKPTDVLKQILLNQGMTEEEFLTAINREMTSNIIAGTVKNGFFSLPDSVVTNLYKAENEKRNADYVVFADKDMTDIPKATDDDLKKLYGIMQENFAIPETRVLQLIRVKDDNLKKTLQISDEELKQAYDQNKDSYYTTGRRQLDEAIFDSEDQAKKVYDQAKGGTALEKAVQNVTSQVVAYIGPKDVDNDKLMAEIKEPVLAAKNAGAVLAPIKTPLGWYVIVVKKIVPEGNTSFEDAKKDLHDELYETKLNDAKYNQATSVDDMIAGGSSLDEVGKKIDIEVTDLPAINQMGQDSTGKDAMKAYGKISPNLLDTGFKLGDNETSSVSEMADGTFMAVHLKSMKAKSYKPFEEVKGDLAKKWMDDQARAENRKRITAIMSDLASGKKTLKDIAKDAGKSVANLTGIGRTSDLLKPLTKQGLPLLFAAGEDLPFVIDADGGAAIASVTKITWPENVTPASDGYKKFKDTLVKQTQDEAMMVYIGNKNLKYKAAINNALLEQAYGTEAQKKP